MGGLIPQHIKKIFDAFQLYLYVLLVNIYRDVLNSVIKLLFSSFLIHLGS